MKTQGINNLREEKSTKGSTETPTYTITTTTIPNTTNTTTITTNNKIAGINNHWSLVSLNINICNTRQNKQTNKTQMERMAVKTGSVLQHPKDIP